MFKDEVIRDIVDLTYLDWDKTRFSSGTAGSYLKAYDFSNGKKVYYKMSSFDSIRGITGHECVNEIIVDRLLNILGINHLHYQLIHCLVIIEGKEYETYVCASEDFKERNDSKIALDDCYDLMKHENESIMEFAKRMNIDDFIYRMLVVDYLIINRDRHGANIELLRKADKTIVPAPLFDHGLSLLFSMHSSDAIDKFDPLADIPVQSYVGTRSAYENLKLIPKEKLPVLRPLKEEDKKYILKDLEGVLPKEHLEKIFDTIWKRWTIYEHMLNKK